MDPMVKVSVMYPNQEGAKFDVEYYCTKHMALVNQLLGDVLKGGGVDEGISTPEAPAPYLAIGHLWFDSIEAFQSALAAHGPTLMADIPNYTNVRPVFQISTVRFSSLAAAH
jgi:uncharacterized protein (TIGR02118 family)